MSNAIIHVATTYRVVQKFCFYCPQALEPNAKSLICDACATAQRLAELNHEPENSPVVQAFVSAVALDVAEIKRLYAFPGGK